MKTTSERITRLTPREWTISIILHLVVFGLLIWFTPARQVLESLGDKKNPPPEEKPRQDPTQVKEVVQAIAKEQADAAREHVKQLADMEKKLDQLTKERLDDYKKQADTIAQTAAQKALDQLKDISPIQDATVQAQKQLSQQQQSTLNDPNLMSNLGRARDQLDAAEMAVSVNQSKTEEAQEKALQLMHFVAQDSPAAQAQQKAIDAENAAAASQQDSAKIQTEINQMGSNVNRRMVDLKREQDRITQVQAQLAAANATAAQDQAAIDAAKAKVDAATTAFNQAHDLAAVDKTPESRQKQNDAHKELQDAQRALNQATAQQNQVLNKAKQLQTQIDTQAGVQRATAALNDVQAKYADLKAQLQATQDASTQAMLTAKQAQADAITQLSAIANTPAAKPAEQPTPSELAIDKEIDASTLDGKNLGQLYETATKTEDRITDKYKVYRATELASIQKMTLADAMQQTEAAKTDREKLDAKLLSSTEDAKDFNAYKTEVIKARQQIQSMIDSSSDMVSTAEMQKNVGKGDVTLQEDNYNQMVAAATAGNEANAAAGKDLTGITGEKDGGHHGQSGQENGSSDVDDAADISKKNGNGGGGAAADDEDVPKTGTGQEYSRVDPELPNMDYANLKPVATRRISEAGAHHADWLYVDSWYFIGPFPNNGRANLHTKFPPESIIDLDAAYPGKNGRTLRWVFTQWNSPNLRPKDDLKDAPAIYYAYTELYFDQPQDLWIATGSDDKGTMWLNDVMVWNSSDTLKGWQPNEGYRKVHFKQGLNRVLYRLENGQFVAAFSLMISVKKS